MAEPEEIFQHLEFFFKSSQKLTGKTVLVTAGPTYEAIDPFGLSVIIQVAKWDLLLLKSWRHEGATVNLITGPTDQRYQSSRYYC